MSMIKTHGFQTVQIAQNHLLVPLKVEDPLGSQDKERPVEQRDHRVTSQTVKELNSRPAIQ